MKKPKFSIIVTVYNIEEQLGRCLNSLVNQSFHDIEIIVVNDGSTDHSQDVIDQFHKNYPDLIRPFIQKNSGGDWGARNTGIKHVSSPFFSFVDGDDYVHPDYALKLYEAITKNNADMAVCGLDRIDIESGKKVTTDMNQYGYKTIDTSGNDSILAFINPGPCNKAYRYEKVKHLRFEAIRGSCDLFFMLAAMPSLEKITIIPDSLYYYMMHRDSQIFNIKDSDLKVFENNFLKIKKLYNKNKKNQRLLNYLDLMVFIHFGISIMYRVSYNSDNLHKKSKEILQFLNTNFKGWRVCPFLTFKYSIKKGFKHFCLYIVSKLYKMNRPLIFIKSYRFMIDKLKIDIKF